MIPSKSRKVNPIHVIIRLMCLGFFLLITVRCQASPVEGNNISDVNLPPTLSQTPTAILFDLPNPTSTIRIQSVAPTMTAIATSIATVMPSLTPTQSPTHVPTATRQLLFQDQIAVLSTENRNLGFIDHGTIEIVDLLSQERISIFEFASGFDWSPDGERLVFYAFNQNTAAYEIYIVNHDGTNLTKLDPDLVGEAHREGPDWSPDGTKIAFFQPEAGEHLIHIMDADGGNIHFLVKGVWPSWSPDGSQIAFMRIVGFRAAGDIFSVDIDGSNVRQLTEGIYAGQPVWSPNGKFIAFYADNDENGNNGLYVYDVEAAQTEFIVPVSGWIPISAPSWSSDSSQIIFAQNGNLFAIQLSNLQVTPLNLPEGYYFWGALRPN